MSNVLNGFAHADAITNDNPLVINGTIVINGTEINANELSNILKSNKVTVYASNGALLNTGIAICSKATGLALSLPAPALGCLLDIRFEILTSGSSVITCASGVTFSDTNDVATFNSTTETGSLRLAYLSANVWQIINSNNVVFS